MLSLSAAGSRMAAARKIIMDFSAAAKEVGLALLLCPVALGVGAGVRLGAEALFKIFKAKCCAPTPKRPKNTFSRNDVKPSGP
jgi:hypothetical protein